MGNNTLPRELAEARELIRTLQVELAETNRGLVALTMELEKRVDERTAELRATQDELKQANSDLLQLTMELEDRVAARTAELQAKNEELKVLSQQLMQAAKLATMGELAASIAHELNNPLATIGLRVESLLQQVKAYETVRRSLEIIDQEAERMARLVANLLQFSRQGVQQISTVRVVEEIDSALELIHYRLRNHSIVVEREYASSTLTILADRQRLRQLLLNVFNNAVDAMRPKGSGTLSIRMQPPEDQADEVSRSRVDTKTERASSSRRFVVMEIADTGIGIAPENLAKVGEPFFTTKPEGQGTGLGLTICRRIAQEHYGTLEITSQLDKGTTVRVVLPLAGAANGIRL